MKEYLGRIGYAVGVGLIWAAAWATVGTVMGIVDSDGAVNELWLGPAIGFYPGFLGGLIFSVVLGIAEGRRRLHEASLPKVIACGGVAGLVVGMLPFAINKPRSDSALWLVGVVVVGSMTLLGAVSAAGSLAAARWWRGPKRRPAAGSPP